MRPTQAHVLKMTALVEHKGESDDLTDLKGYDLMLSLLRRHKRDLKQIQSNERKEAFKRSILPDYLPWIEGALSARSGKQDDVLMHWLVWAIDCEEYQLALKIAEYALSYDLVLPEQFERTLATVIAETFANKALYADTEAQQDYLLTYLLKVQTLTDGQDMPDLARAKLYKMIGLFSEKHAPEYALDTLSRALKLNPFIGVKTAVKRLKKRLGVL